MIGPVRQSTSFYGGIINFDLIRFKKQNLSPPKGLSLFPTIGT
jgi:hypothetical protein